MRKLIWTCVVVSALFISFATSAMEGQVDHERAEAEAYIAQIILAHQYEHNFDYVKALECFRKAAQWGGAEALFSIGSDYEVGNGGVQMDYTEALKWYHKAVKGKIIRGGDETWQRGASVAIRNIETRLANSQKLKDKKEIGDTVCDIDGSRVGQVEKVYKDKIEIIRNGTKLEWIKYDDVIKCD